MASEPIPLTKLYVKGGACINPLDTVIITSPVCALEASACSNIDDSLVFRSSRQLILAGPTAPGYACLNSVLNIPIGRCVGGPSAFACTSSKTACLEDVTERFIENDPTCTVVGDVHPDRQRTNAIYGECARVGTSGNSVESHLQIGCFWSEIDCRTAIPTDIHWQKDGTAWDEICTCDMVDTGACQDSSNDFYCAVSRDGCDKDSHYRPYWDLPEKIQCQLCPPLFPSDVESITQINFGATSYPTSPPFVVTTPVTPSVGSAPTSLPATDPGGVDKTEPTSMPTHPTLLRNDQAETSDDRNTNAAVLGVTLALAIALFSVAIVGRALYKRKRAQKERPHEEAEPDEVGTDPNEPSGVFS